MELSPPIELKYTKENALALLKLGAEPDMSPYSHKQIAEWCERFWLKYSDIDAPDEIEAIMPVLADVETQWDLFLANTYSLAQLQSMNYEPMRLPAEWFANWYAEANA